MESDNDIDDISGAEESAREADNEANNSDMTCESKSSTSSVRRGGRIRKPVSREDSLDIDEPMIKSKKRGPKVVDKSKKPFCCDNCKSAYVVNPKRSISKKDPKRPPAPRYKIDPETGKKLTLCNACGLLFNRQQKSNEIKQKKPPAATDEDRRRWAEECDKFSQSLASGMNDPEAARFTCTVFKTKACGCLQKYIIGDGDDPEGCTARTNNLLNLLKKAKALRLQKCYNQDDVDNKGKKRIGLGNGHKKSKEYEEFVLSKRQYLREELKICELGVKKVLLYSNNFLHRGLKTEDRPWRVERVRGKSARGLLKTIEEMRGEQCCDDQCILLAKTHAFLLRKWRERATSSQAEARKVLGEMLTPSGGRTNCFNFIAMVTGSSARTIGRVKEQMQKTGGNREPPPHGLIEYWQKNPYNKKPKISTRTSDMSNSSNKQACIESTSVIRNTKNMSQEELEQHQSNLEKMQSHLEMKRQRIEQQQRLVEEQLNKHKQEEQQRKKQKQQQKNEQQLIEQEIQRQKLAEQRQKEQQRQAQTEISRLSQLFTDMQGQVLGHQLQQQMLSSTSAGNAAAQALQNAAVLSASHPPPSYNVAVALNSTNTASAQQSIATSSNQSQPSVVLQTTSSNQSQPSVVLQTTNISVLPNLLLAGNSLQSHQLLGMQNHSAAQTSALSSVNQQILVSLSQNLNNLTSDLNTDASLSDQSSSDDQLNLSDVMSPESSVQNLTRLPVNQNKSTREHQQLMTETATNEMSILVPANTNNNGSNTPTDHSSTVQSLLSSQALQIFSENSENIILQIPVSINMPTVSTQSPS